MKEKKLTTYRIRKDNIIGQATLQSLKNDEPVSTETISTLCKVLNCQPGDIMEYVDDWCVPGLEVTMIPKYTIEEIKSIVSPIARKYGVERVYLFGLYARGDATTKSDVNLRVDKGSL